MPTTYLPLLQSETLQLLDTAEKHTWQVSLPSPQELLMSSEQNKQKIPNFIRMQNY